MQNLANIALTGKTRAALKKEANNVYKEKVIMKNQPLKERECMLHKLLRIFQKCFQKRELQGHFH